MIHGGVDADITLHISIRRGHLVPTDRLILIEKMSEVSLFVRILRQVAATQPADIGDQGRRKVMENAPTGGVDQRSRRQKGPLTTENRPTRTIGVAHQLNTILGRH